MLAPLRAWRSSFWTTSLWLCGQCQDRLQPPAVDDVADQIDRLGLVVAQEIDQELGLGRPRAEMDVGDEQACGTFAAAPPCMVARTVAFAQPMPRFMQQAYDGCDWSSVRYSLPPNLQSWREVVMDLGIRGKKAIVCASSRGLGKGCALALAEAGCDLVVNGRDAKALARTATEIRDRFGVDVIEISGDVSDPAVQKRAARRRPRPDILVNNNGGPPFRPFSELDREAILEGRHPATWSRRSSSSRR